MAERCATINKTKTGSFQSVPDGKYNFWHIYLALITSSETIRTTQFFFFLLHDGFRSVQLRHTKKISERSSSFLSEGLKNHTPTLNGGKIKTRPASTMLIYFHQTYKLITPVETLALCQREYCLINDKLLLHVPLFSVTYRASNLLFATIM